MAAAYQYIYLVFLGMVLYQQLSISLSESPLKYGYEGTSTTSVSWLMLACILFIGFRPNDIVFFDMVSYHVRYVESFGIPYKFNWEVENKIFDQILPLMASMRIHPDYYFVLIAAIYYGGMYVACKKLFPNNFFVAYLVCLTAFSTFNYAVNGFKSGAAGSIFLCAIAYREKKLLAIVLALVSVGFHHSMKVVFISFAIAYFYKNTKYYFWGWIVAVIFAFLHIKYFQMLFADYTSKKGLEYLLGKNDEAFLTGFRVDFMLYSSVPIIIGYWLKYKIKQEDAGYDFWLRMYLLTNSVWMLCMYASFSNRIAYLSWFMYPIVLIYPFFKISWSSLQTLYAKRVVLWHYLFTLFMQVIYYGLIKS